MQEHIFFLTIHLTRQDSFAHIRPHHILPYSSQKAVRGLSTVVDQGEGPGGPGLPLILGKKRELQKEEKQQKPRSPLRSRSGSATDLVW